MLWKEVMLVCLDGALVTSPIAKTRAVVWGRAKQFLPSKSLVVCLWQTPEISAICSFKN